MNFPPSFSSIRRSRFFQGFTQIEILVIVFIIGIMASIAAPSFGGMLESARMKQATVEIRSALQETQRQSIRSNQACTANVLIPANEQQQSLIQGNCLSSGDRPLPDGIGLATNVLPEATKPSSSSSSSGFSPGSVTVHRAGPGQTICQEQSNGECKKPSRSSSSSASSSDDFDDDFDDSEAASNPKNQNVSVGFDPLGAANFKIVTPANSAKINSPAAKFISFRPNRLEAKKTCLVLSRSLGLTRIGTYQGTLEPNNITNGKCQVATWEEQ